MRYRLLIFDFDGTLADTYPAFERALDAAIPHFGLRTVSPEDVAHLRTLSAREIISHLGIPLWKVPAVGKFIRERMAAEPLQLFPGIAQALRILSSAALTLAIVSSNSEANVRRVLGPDLSALVAAFDCGTSLFGKSSRFKKVIKRTGHTAAETLTIGDELRDAEAAATAGIDFGAVAWGYTTLAGLERTKPKEIFRTSADLLALAR